MSIEFMPRYKCHKEVSAVKIHSIEIFEDYSAMITPSDGHARFSVGREYVLRHHPQVGGYYVLYDDGYKSFSPAKAFEEGYTLITS